MIRLGGLIDDFYLNKLFEKGGLLFFFFIKKFWGKVVLFQRVCREGKLIVRLLMWIMSCSFFFVFYHCVGSGLVPKTKSYSRAQPIVGEGSTVEGGSYYKILKRDKAKAVILQSVGC